MDMKKLHMFYKALNRIFSISSQHNLRKGEVIREKMTEIIIDLNKIYSKLFSPHFLGLIL
jgi:hypothetical protein